MSGTTKTNLPSRNPRRSGIVIPNKPTGSQRLVAILVWVITNTIAATVRFRIHDPHEVLKRKDFGPAIYCAWHNRLALSIKAYFRYSRPRYDATGVAALVSASKDGAFLAAILQNFGVQPVRGSSSRRGAQALLELASWAERGYDLAVTPDGPRGPRYVVQEGVVALAQVTGLPIIPYSCQLGWKIRVKSWDGFQIPLPFSHCEMTFGELIRVPRTATDAEREQLREQLGAALLAGARDEGSP